MTRSCSRIALIERPINEPIEKHRCRAGKYHTNNHQEQNSPRGPAVCCHNQRAKRKRQRKDRVRKTNQPQKTTDRSAFDLAHNCRREDFLQKAINETKVLTEFIKPLSYLRFLPLTCLPRIRDCHPANFATVHLHLTQSACRARRGCARLCSPKVFATSAAFVFRSSNTSQVEM